MPSGGEWQAEPVKALERDKRPKLERRQVRERSTAEIEKLIDSCSDTYGPLIATAISRALAEAVADSTPATVVGAACESGEPPFR
jgi:hypothetical protein